jgi:HEAT repeat protein
MQWKFGVMLADAKDARQDRVTRLTGLLASDSSLQRAAAALSLVWYADKGSVEPLRALLQDPDETVRTTAAWALAALQRALLYRNQFDM